MGFGSGGGFTPSPNVVPGSTQTGTDKDTDVHEFTGSVDITGSLTLNGSPVGGGGGGTPGGANTQVQFNDNGSFGGSSDFTFDGSTVTTPDAKVNGDLVVENTSGAVLTVSGSGGDGTDTYLAVEGNGDVGIRLYADQNNSDESDNPYIDFYQDGQGATRTRARRLATMGLESSNGTSFTDSYANGFYIDAFYPSLLNSARTFQIATDSTNNGHRARISVEGTNGFVGIETNSPTALLHVSSSTSEPLFRVDHSTQAGSQPILYVTGSGLVGIGTDAPRTDAVDTNRLHILGESGADQGQDPVDNTLLMLENNDHVGVQFMTPIDKSGFLVWGDADAARVAHFYFLHNDNRFHFDSAPYGTEAMTIRASGDSVNMGENNSAHMLTAKAALHISSSTGGTDVGGPVLLRVDHADQPGAQPTLFVTGSGRVGIGTETPDTTLQVLSTSTQQKWSYDTDSFATLTVADDSVTTLASGESGDIVIDAAGDIYLEADGGQIYMSDPGGANKLKFDVQATTAYIDLLQNAPLIFRLGSSGASEIARFDQATDSFRLATDSPVQFRDTATAINSPASNRLAITAPTLEVSGNLHVSGAFGSTAIETLTANGTISANTGLTLIDASSSLAVNNTLLFSIADGTFAGQEKKIRGLIISGSDGANSTGIYIFGSNIDSPPFLGGSGQIVLSSSNPAAGPSFERAGCSLVWDGSKWLPVGNYNFNINTTGF